MLSHDSIGIGKFFHPYAAKMVFHFQGSTQLYIIPQLFDSLELLMVYALQSLNLNISALSKSLGVDQVATNPSSRCSLQTSGLTRLRQRELTLLPETCLMEH